LAARNKCVYFIGGIGEEGSVPKKEVRWLSWP
jgi:hypothetical protein